MADFTLSVEQIQAMKESDRFALSKMALNYGAPASLRAVMEALNVEEREGYARNGEINQLIVQVLINGPEEKLDAIRPLFAAVNDARWYFDSLAAHIVKSSPSMYAEAVNTAVERFMTAVGPSPQWQDLERSLNLEPLITSQNSQAVVNIGKHILQQKAFNNVFPEDIREIAYATYQAGDTALLDKIVSALNEDSFSRLVEEVLKYNDENQNDNNIFLDSILHQYVGGQRTTDNFSHHICNEARYGTIESTLHLITFAEYNNIPLNFQLVGQKIKHLAKKEPERYEPVIQQLAALEALQKENILPHPTQLGINDAVAALQKSWQELEETNAVNKGTVSSETAPVTIDYAKIDKILHPHNERERVIHPEDLTAAVRKLVEESGVEGAYAAEGRLTIPKAQAPTFMQYVNNSSKNSASRHIRT